MGITFLNERWSYIPCRQDYWHIPLNRFFFTARWTHWRKSLVLWHRDLTSEYHAHFRFSDPFLNPIGQLDRHTFDDWPDNHIPFFVPIPDWNCGNFDHQEVGLVILICKDHIRFLTKPISVAAVA